MKFKISPNQSSNLKYFNISIYINIYNDLTNFKFFMFFLNKLSFEVILILRKGLFFLHFKILICMVLEEILL